MINRNLEKKSPRRGIEPRSPAFWLSMTGGDTDHYTIEDVIILTIQNMYTLYLTLEIENATFTGLHLMLYFLL